MIKIIFTVLIVVAVAVYADAKKKCFPLPTPVVDPPPPQPACAKNEVYSVCGANGCQNTCENPTLGQVCRAMCIAGCVCKEGYLRDSKGKCVLVKDCPQIPECKKAHESYTDCGTACPLTCEEPLPRPCTKQCVKGCFCDKGYIRDKKGNCVKVEDCPKPKCGRNENYNSCGASPCQATCKEKDLPKMCKAPCKPGCGCNEGYVRDDDGDCILLDDCPPASQADCGDNEVYEACTHICGEPTCKRSEPLYCGRGECEPKCLCKKGYFRTPEGDCIPKEKCPAFKCGMNENYNECGGSPCQATCKEPDLPKMCKAPCKPGCGCKEGYVRNDDGDCIHLKDCPPGSPADCGDNEVYACTEICGEPTCERSQALYCGLDGCHPKCLCKKGFVRNADMECIKSKDCPAPQPKK